MLDFQGAHVRTLFDFMKGTPSLTSIYPTYLDMIFKLKYSDYSSTHTYEGIPRPFQKIAVHSRSSAFVYIYL